MTNKVDYITRVLRFLHWFPVCQRIDFKMLLLACKALSGLNTCLTFCYTINHRDLLGLLGQVCFVSLKSRLNMGKQCLVFMHHKSGTNSSAATLSSFKSRLRTPLFTSTFYLLMSYTALLLLCLYFIIFSSSLMTFQLYSNVL